MKRETIPRLPQYLTPRVCQHLDTLRDFDMASAGCCSRFRPPEVTVLSERVRDFDPTLFFKWNMYAGSLEVWERPGGKEVGDNRHTDLDRLVFNCDEIAKGRMPSAWELKRKLWDIDISNPKNISVEAMIENIDIHNAKLEKEKLHGTADEQGLFKEGIEKKMTDVGFQGSKFLKGGKPVNRFI